MEKEKPIKKKWFYCPKCGSKICKVGEHPTAKEIYVYCRRCKRQIELNI